MRITSKPVSQRNQGDVGANILLGKSADGNKFNGLPPAPPSCDEISAMNRRSFIRLSAAACAALHLPRAFAEDAASIRLTLRPDRLGNQIAADFTGLSYKWRNNKQPASILSRQPTAQSASQLTDQPVSQSTSQSTDRPAVSVDTKTVDRPKSFYITLRLDKRLDTAVRYLQETHGLKKVDRSILVNAMLDIDEQWTDEALDLLVERVVHLLTNKMVR